ncbi:hypothetical protein F4553_002724 [Allocatelliglobosispora scoriae]|uniref:Uncharacterized protein n=1 Tax=Allocatelliglobosispora scoriae TaxID=643052 RepID=A0A841BNU3_9ACTN|nr:hypothetical protein [Allocatelliglobosispora scoriae]MBB5869345.1 hypothetical protein [Allocatelliglobosispora scoriae]
MSGAVPVVLFALAGILVGGAWSLYKQGAHRGVVAVVGLFALVSAAGGVAWLMPGEV